jgi:acyl carrier protein
MTRDELKAIVLGCLTSIAPEIDVEHLAAAQSLRNQVDLDSVDWMNFLVALHAKLGIDIPDADAARLTTLDKLLDYCAGKLK